MTVRFNISVNISVNIMPPLHHHYITITSPLHHQPTIAARGVSGWRGMVPSERQHAPHVPLVLLHRCALLLGEVHLCVGGDTYQSIHMVHTPEYTHAIGIVHTVKSTANTSPIPLPCTRYVNEVYSMRTELSPANTTRCPCTVFNHASDTTRWALQLLLRAAAPHIHALP